MNTGRRLLVRIAVICIFSVMVSLSLSAESGEYLLSDTAAPDLYEDDDTYNNASIIILEDEPQLHNFHNKDDADWFKFYGIAGQGYAVASDNLGNTVDMVISLYDTDGISLIKEKDTIGPDIYANEKLIWKCLRSGVYYVRLNNHPLNDINGNAEYNVIMEREDAPIIFSLITGTITDISTGMPVGGALVSTDQGASTISIPNGMYAMYIPPGPFELTVHATGYKQYGETLTINEEEKVTNDITMSRSCQDGTCFNEYDQDRDSVIDDFELLTAIDDWADAILGDFELLSLIDFWAEGCYQWDELSGNFIAGCEDKS